MSPRMMALVALLALLVLSAVGCSSSRSTPVNPADGGDANIGFPDAWGDMFVPPSGSSLRGELTAGGSALQGGDYTLHGVVGEPIPGATMSGGGYSLQWDSVVLPIPQP